jgi:hypothetical protein
MHSQNPLDFKYHHPNTLLLLKNKHSMERVVAEERTSKSQIQI